GSGVLRVVLSADRRRVQPRSRAARERGLHQPGRAVRPLRRDAGDLPRQLPLRRSREPRDRAGHGGRAPVTLILGVSAFYHDSAAALLRDGEIVAAAQEERFSRRKHDEGFPHGAVDYCLRAAGVTVKDLDYVGFYEKPLAKFDRLMRTYLAFAPQGY